jgi:diguanylate cyclase (GGDEF)-like protein
MTEKELLPLFMGLTKKRDGFSLSSYFLKDALPAILEGSEFSLFEVISSKNNLLKESANLTFRSIEFVEERIDHRLDLVKIKDFCRQDSLDFHAHIHLTDGNAVIPLKSEVGPLRLVLISEFPDEPEKRVSTLHLTQMFSNLVNTLDRMERDQLTKLLNRNSFDGYFNRLLQKQKSKPSSHLWLAILDIDHFKRVNDTFGHLYGDEVLLHFSQLMEKHLRSHDIPFRFGGEEFVLLFETGSAEDALKVLDRFRSKVEEYNFPGVGKVTVSIGFSQSQPNLLPTSLIDQADKALYHAKENGRNRVIHYAWIRSDAEESIGEIDLF